jgi:elongation factor Ts
MSEITATSVKSLREKTGAGMMECKKALVEAQGNEEQAIEILRKHGLASARKKEGRIAAEGAVGSYIHMGGKVGVLVEVNCELISARRRISATGQGHCHVHAATEPRFVSKDEVPAMPSTKSARLQLPRRAMIRRTPTNLIRVIAKIVEGRINKFYEEAVFGPAFVKIR